MCTRESKNLREGILRGARFIERKPTIIHVETRTGVADRPRLGAIEADQKIWKNATHRHVVVVVIGLTFVISMVASALRKRKVSGGSHHDRSKTPTIDDEENEDDRRTRLAATQPDRRR